MTITEKFVNHCYELYDNMFKNVNDLQIRQRKCNVANIFSVMIGSSFSDNKEINFEYLFKRNLSLASSTISYWRNKIYSLFFDFDLHAYSVNNQIKCNYDFIKTHSKLFDRFNILAGDMTKCKSYYRNKSQKGKNIASIGISALFDIKHRTFRSYKISKTNNENEALLEQNMSKKDLIILDRFYSSPKLLSD